jgi:hypothetical protein
MRADGLLRLEGWGEQALGEKVERLTRISNIHRFEPWSRRLTMEQEYGSS